MTEDRNGVEHVLDAIDNALWDWTESPDAMTVRYGDGGAPGGKAVPPERRSTPDTILQDGRRLTSWDEVDPSRPWHLVPGEGTPPSPAHAGDEGYLFPEGWRDVGFIEEADLLPAGFRDDDDVEIHTWNSPVPIRVVSTRLMPDGMVWVGRLPEGAALPSFLSVAADGSYSVGFDPEALNAGFRRAGAAARGLGEACRLAVATSRPRLAELTEQFHEIAAAGQRIREQMDAEHREFMERMVYGDRSGVPLGIVPSGVPDDPRERALDARRNRNTGPARNPHRHRGI